MAVEGWLGLGDAASATLELKEISPEARENPVVLRAQYQIHAHAEKWDQAVEIADKLTLALPDESATWIWFAFATRRKTGGTIQEAKKILEAWEPKFPGDYLFPFNLACYCAQLGEFPEAERWLRKASSIDEKAVQKMAVDDPDLKPLWDHFDGTFWE